MKVFAENRKARNSYEFLNFLKLELYLQEQKQKVSRNGGISIIDAFATVLKEKKFSLREMNIEPYKYADLIDYDPKTPRKLLLHKKEIKRLIGLTIYKRSYIILQQKYLNKMDIIKIELASGKR